MRDDSLFLPYALPALDEQEEQAVLEVLRSGWLTTGPKTKQFEEAFGCWKTLHTPQAQPTKDAKSAPSDMPLPSPSTPTKT
jgi:hypothetical protein